MRAPRSYVINGCLAAATLYFVLDLSRGDRGPIDWIAIGLLGLAILWNILKAGQRLHRRSGERGLSHLSRVLLLWTVGLINALPEWGEAETTWRLPLGVTLLVLAFADTMWLARREYVAATSPAQDPAPPPR